MKIVRAGFSLIELLTVVAVIGTLAAFGFAGVNRLIQNSKVTGCISNLKQIGAAAKIYAGDNNGRLPQSDHEGDSWASVTRIYLGTAKCNRSPLDPNKSRTYSYNINDYILENPMGYEHEGYNPMSDGPGFFLLQRIPNPSQTLYLTLSQTNNLSSDHFHFVSSGYSKNKFLSQVWSDIGDGKSQYLFVDGHVERKSTTEVQAELSKRGSRFIRPDGHP